MVGIEGTTGSLTNTTHRANVTETNEIAVTQFSEGIGPGTIDKSTHNLSVIQTEHHKIHEGNHFLISDFDTLNSGESLYFGVITPNGSKWAHLTYDIVSTLLTEIRIWEGATLSGGTTVDSYNNNRNSPNTSSVIIKLNPTISGTTPTSGTLISASAWGTTSPTPSKLGVGGGTSRVNELILKSGTNYIFQITSVVDNNLISYDAIWYEHTDKTQQF